MKGLLRVLALALVIGTFGQSARAALTFTDNFNSYAPGSRLVDQSPWTALGGISENAPTITGDGRVLLSGSKLETYQDRLGGFYFVPINEGGLATAAVSVDLALEPDAAASPETVNSQLYSLTGDYIAGIYLFADGTLLWDNVLGDVGTLDVAVGKSYRLSMFVDFELGTIDYRMDGALLGTLSYFGDRSIGDFDIGYGSTGPVSNGRAYMDNYSVAVTAAVPEPASVISVASGAGLLACWTFGKRKARRRRSAV